LKVASFSTIILISVLLLGMTQAARPTLATTTPAAATPDFTVQVTPNNITIGHTPAYGVLITVTSVNSFSGTVALASTRPGGLATGPGPTSVTLSPNGIATSVLYFDTSFVPPGDYLVNLTGTSDSLVRFAIFNITLVGPTFQISASPAVVTIVPGVSLVASQISITSRDNFTGPVQVYGSASGATLEASFSPSSVTPPANGTVTSELTIYGPLGDVNPGTYNLEVSAFNQGTLFSTTRTTKSRSPSKTWQSRT
jgi:hypothetical protein